MKVSIGVSKRHIHLTDEHLKILFGDDFKLEKRNFGKDTWEKNGVVLFSGFIFTKKQLKKLLKVKIEN